MLCTCGAESTTLFCCVRTYGLSFVPFKNTVLCTAKLFALMDIRMYWQKLVSALTVEWALFVFLCSCVLVSFYYSILLDFDLVPWSRPGMTRCRHCAVPWIFTCFLT